jgi:anti-sigma B factor antagonist
MNLEMIERDTSTIIIVDSLRIDAAVAARFKTGLMNIIESGVREMVLDLSGVRMIDSSGLGALVSVLKSMNGSGSISIRGASPAVLGLFQLTRMDRVFPIVGAVGA